MVAARREQPLGGRPSVTSSVLVKLAAMSGLPGFGVSGYRTLSGEAQWIPLDGAVTVFLGGNNSGKSNILRLVHEHMMQIFQSLKQNDSINSFDPRVDAPLGLDAGLEVHWPLDVGAVLESSRFAQIREAAERILELPQLNRFGVPSLPFTAPGLNQPLEITLHAAQAIMEESSGINWEHISGVVSSHRGGQPGEDTLRVLLALREGIFAAPETIFVPPSRAVTGGADSGQWDFSGTGMIHQLARLKAPAFDENYLRERAQALTHDLRILLEDDELQFDVQHDRSTVNILLGGQWFPLESLGTGTGHAVVILAARHVYPDRLLCLEEPDAHLHPRLQRRLISLLREVEGRRLVVATHSAHMIDAADKVVGVQLEGRRSAFEVVGDHALFDALRALGYRASDLLQANSVIWVEGPSDRIYLLHWLSAVDPDLVEGVDFSIVFYGGALLARLSARGEEAAQDPTLIDLWRINRRMWMVMDSDRGEGELRPAVERLRGEIEGAGTGGTWITAGYTVENYVDPVVLNEAVRETHPSVDTLAAQGATVDPLAGVVKGDGQPLRHADKVAIALAVCARPANLDVLDLRNRVTELAGFIREAPGERLTPVVLDELTSASD
jgi:hypothetical protein